QTWVTSLAYIEPVGRSRMIATGDGNRGQRSKIILWIENSEKSSSKFSRSWVVILKIWREASTALGIYFTKPTLPATPSPSLRPVITSSPLTTKSRRLLEILEDLLPVFDYKNAFACATFLDTGNMSSSIHCRCIGVIVISQALGSNFALCRASVVIVDESMSDCENVSNEELVHASTIQGLNVIVNQWYSHDGRQKEILLYLSLGMYFFIDCNQELNTPKSPIKEQINHTVKVQMKAPARIVTSTAACKVVLFCQNNDSEALTISSSLRGA
ncbi:hypothetical protein GGU11DRAFT_761521, partial [Lentinula aff. detonsa]